MTPQRPALAEVLAALDAPTADGLTVGDGPAMSPVEAVEALATARMWPWEPGEGPRWRCEACCGCGGMDGIGGYVDCDACASTGDSTAPPTLAALVAVASLGAPQLARYVHLAGEIARAVTYGNARVVWRVMAREAIVAWAMDRRGKTCRSTADLVVAMAVEGVLSPSYLAIPHAMPWAPALRSLAIGDEATPQPTGVHLVGLDASGIVLAVEAL